MPYMASCVQIYLDASNYQGASSYIQTHSAIKLLFISSILIGQLTQRWYLGRLQGRLQGCLQGATIYGNFPRPRPLVPLSVWDSGHAIGVIHGSFPLISCTPNRLCSLYSLYMYPILSGSIVQGYKCIYRHYTMMSTSSTHSNNDTQPYLRL